jgi:aconitate hydratase
VEGIDNELIPNREITVRAKDRDGSEKVFRTVSRLDSNIEIEYYRNGGILQTFLRQMISGN